MPLITKSQLVERAQRASGYQYETNVREAAVNAMILAKNAADASADVFDVFLSHSSEDAILIRGLRDELMDFGLSVYVDWVNDPQLDRSRVTVATAAALRRRMDSCRTLLYATSNNSRGSVWMPWELGYMDAKSQSRVAIVPIIDNHDASGEYSGIEYLGLYPYLDKTGNSFWIHRTQTSFVGFAKWQKGVNP